MASSHYSKPVLEPLKQENIKLLPKDRNLPNVPMIRPVETFWSHFKTAIFKDGFKPKTIDIESKICCKEIRQNILRKPYEKGSL